MCGCVGCDSDVRAVKIAAWKGDAMAQYNLGVMYEKGNNLREMNSDGSSSPSKVVLPQDYAQAAKWYRAAAEQGLADAQNDLGKMYLKGKGVVQDHAEAMKWRRLAAERGHVGAQYWLGAKYHHSIGVPQDDAEAVKWYRLAADQGDAMAQEALGDLYRQGEGVPRDYAEAVRWYRLAAEQGLDCGSLEPRGNCTKQAKASHRTPWKRTPGILWPPIHAGSLTLGPAERSSLADSRPTKLSARAETGD